RQAEIRRAQSKPTERLDAYDYYLRALQYYYTLADEDVDKAVALLEQAIAIDPDYTLAKALVARCYAWRSSQGRTVGRQEERETAIRLGHEALRTGSDDSTVLWMVGFVLWLLRTDPDSALDLYDRSLAMNPNCAQAHTRRGWALASIGRCDHAL